MSIYSLLAYLFFLCFAAEATGQSASQTGSGTAPGGRRGAGAAGWAPGPGRAGPARGASFGIGACVLFPQTKPPETLSPRTLNALASRH